MTTTTKSKEARVAEVPKGPYLSQLAGMPKARAWGEQLAADIAFYRRGECPWQDIDAGLILYGPPGTGKTTLARAIAATAELPLIATSYSEWTRGKHYGVDIMNAILDTFEQARANAPCIVAIDEIDSIPSRANIPADHNATYNIVNTLLDQLDGLNKRPGVIVIGTCNNFDRLDPALVRPGRLGRAIEVPLPSQDALPQIIAFHLGYDAARIGDLTSIAIMCSGMSGAMIEQFVRDARSRARRLGRSIRNSDLIDTLQARTATRDAATDRRIAVHEAGHAVAAYRLFPTSTISLSIVPTDDRGGQFNFTYPAGPLTHESLRGRLIVWLAGRAAEEVFLGNVSAGAGGRANSDLAKASSLALDAVASYGLSSSGALFWHRPAGDALAHTPHHLQQEAQTIVAHCYAEAKSLIEREWDYVHNTAEALIRQRALSHRQFAMIDRKPRAA